MAGVPAGAVPGMAGMTAVPGAGMAGVPGMARVPGGLYSAEKQAGLYPTPQMYQSLSPAQQNYLAQVSQAAAQQGYFASGQPAYLTATSPSGQQRYMVSQPYPGGNTLVSSASVLTGAPGYPLTASAAGYPLTVTTSLGSQSPAGYPTYINSQFGPMQISPSQSPYATAAGHPLYSNSPYAGLQMQQAQVAQGQVPAQLAGRVPAGYTAVSPAQYNAATSGLPLGYPYTY